MRHPHFKKITGFLLLFFLLSFSFWLKAQPVHPYGWPLGSRNQLGVYSPLSIAAGETILSQTGPQAALLNPALLALVNGLSLAISGRLIHAFTENSYNYDNLWTDYSCNTLNPDFSGLALKSGDWRFGLGYSLLEEYSRPEILQINAYIILGLALSLKKFGLEGSVKLPLAGIKDSYYIDSSSYHLGLNFRF